MINVFFWGGYSDFIFFYQWDESVGNSDLTRHFEGMCLFGVPLLISSLITLPLLECFPEEAAQVFWVLQDFPVTF